MDNVNEKKYDYVRYDEVYKFKDGFALVKLNNKWGFINEKGEEICDIKYDDVSIFKDGFAPVKLNGKWSLINSSGKEICEIKYDWCCLFKDGFAFVKLNNKWGFINTEGNEICKPKYDGIFDFKDGFVHKSNLSEFIPLKIISHTIGSRNDLLYYGKYKDTYVLHTGCFIGTLEQFEQAVIETHGENNYGKQYMEVINKLKKESVKL